MIEQNNNKEQFVKMSTLYLGIFIGVAIGFILGIAFGVWKTSSMPHMAENTGQVPQEIHQENADEITHLIDQMEQEVANHPENYNAWISLGNAFFDSDQYKKAINAYQKALSINPDNANVWTDLGVMYRRNKEPSKAVNAFDKAIDVDPKHEISRFNKGVVLMHDLNQPEKAVQAWEELLKVNPLAKAPGGHSVDELIKSLKQKSQPE